MNAEILLLKIKEYLESSDEFQNSEIHVLPCMGNPKYLQSKVSFMIFDKISSKGMIPTFTITVNSEGKNV